MKPIDSSTRAARPRSLKRRELTVATTRQFMQNGSQTCELCEGAVAAGNSVWGSGDGSSYMRRHLDRCEMASEADRAHFKAHGKWPNRRRR